MNLIGGLSSELIGGLSNGMIYKTKIFCFETVFIHDIACAHHGKVFSSTGGTPGGGHV